MAACSAPGALLLRYGHEWGRHTSLLASLDRVFNHVNNNFVKNERGEGRVDVCVMSTVSSVAFYVQHETYLPCRHS